MHKNYLLLISISSYQNVIRKYITIKLNLNNISANIDCVCEISYKLIECVFGINFTFICIVYALILLAYIFFFLNLNGLRARISVNIRPLSPKYVI